MQEVGRAFVRPAVQREIALVSARASLAIGCFGAKAITS